MTKIDFEKQVNIHDFASFVEHHEDTYFLNFKRVGSIVERNGVKYWWPYKCEGDLKPGDEVELIKKSDHIRQTVGLEYFN